jgi:hypothetical protein
VIWKCFDVWGVSGVGCRLWGVGCGFSVVGLVSNFLMGLSELEMLWSYCFRFSVVGCGVSVVGCRLWVLGFHGDCA